MKARNKYL